MFLPANSLRWTFLGSLAVAASRVKSGAACPSATLSAFFSSTFLSSACMNEAMASRASPDTNRLIALSSFECVLKSVRYCRPDGEGTQRESHSARRPVHDLPGGQEISVEDMPA